MNLSILKPAIALFLFTAIAAVIVGYMYTITKYPIAEQTVRREREAIESLFPLYTASDYELIDIPGSSIWRVDSSFNANGELLGYVFFARSPGYSGLVHMLVGIDAVGEILGIRVVRHTETPGIGSNITQESFKNQFIGLRGPVRSVRNPQGAHEVDVITGATLSLNAVLKAVNDAWEIFVNR